MGAIRLTDEVHEYLKKQAKEDETLDDVVRRLIGYKKGDVNRIYIRKDLLLPREFLMSSILDCFLAFDTEYIRPMTIRAFVENYLNNTGNRERFAKDFEKDKKGQERWKNRLSSALADLVRKGILIRTASDKKNWVGGSYSVNEELLLERGRELDADLDPLHFHNIEDMLEVGTVAPQIALRRLYVYHQRNSGIPRLEREIENVEKYRTLPQMFVPMNVREVEGKL